MVEQDIAEARYAWPQPDQRNRYYDRRRDSMGRQKPVPAGNTLPFAEANGARFKSGAAPLSGKTFRSGPKWLSPGVPFPAACAERDDDKPADNGDK